MSPLSRAAARCAMWLVPDERRDWAAALWAEADQVPPGRARLAWRASGVRFVVREARLVARAASALAFAAAAVWLVHVAWPGPASNPATGLNRLTVVTLLPALAVLPLLVRWLFGPVAPGPLARVLRYGTYAAVLVLALAEAVVSPVADNPAAAPLLNPDAPSPVKDGMIATWLNQSVFLFVVAVYVAAVLALTARRPRVAPATVAVGAGTGLLLGAVMYAIFPLGLTSSVTNPLLPGFAAFMLVALAWILLFAAPAFASVVAARRYRGLRHADTAEEVGPEQLRKGRFLQGVAAGFLATAIGALTVAVLGTATVALMPRSGWLLARLYPGRHLTAAAAYLPELTASVRVTHYLLVLAIFPVIGLLIGLGGGEAADTNMPPGGGPPPPGGHEPIPDPSAGIGVAADDADAPLAA